MLRRLTLCLVISSLLLAACSAQPTEAPTIEPTPSFPPTQQPSSQPVGPRRTLEPAATMPPIQVLVQTPTTAPTLGPTPTPEATLIPESTVTETEAITQTLLPTLIPLPTIAPPPPSTNPLVQPTPEPIVANSALTILRDETPAPPLTVIVSMNREFAGYHFEISGLVRNDDTVPYTDLDMNATFFRADGSRFGPVQVNVQCPILEPGDSCPFLLDTIDKDITQVMLHPDGHPTDRNTVPVDLSGVSASRDAIGYVHIKGSVHNPNPVIVRDITITGALIDQSGVIVNTGVALLLDPLAPGASTSFDVVITPVSYVQYQLYVQALPQ